jgi:uncharacterized Zn finger protein (UPF0148 family)
MYTCPICDEKLSEVRVRIVTVESATFDGEEYDDYQTPLFDGAEQNEYFCPECGHLITDSHEEMQELLNNSRKHLVHPTLKR